MAEVTSEFNAAINEATNALNDLQRTTNQVMGLVGSLAAGLGEVIGVLSETSAIFDKLTGTISEVLETFSAVSDVVLDVAGDLTQFGGKILEVTTALGGWALTTAGAQQDFKRGFQSILGQEQGQRLFEQVLAVAPRARGTQEDFMRMAQFLISEQRFRPTEGRPERELELGRAMGLLADIQAGGMIDRTHMMELLRIFVGGERLGSRQTGVFAMAGLPIEEVARNLAPELGRASLSAEDFRRGLNRGTITQEQFLHALERMDVQLRGTSELGEYAVRVGSRSIGGILQNLVDLPQQMFAQWLESIDTAHNATFAGSSALSSFATALSEVNNILTNAEGQYPQVARLIGQVFDELITGIFGNLGTTNVHGIQGAIEEFLTTLRDDVIPTFIGAKDAAVAFFQGIWAGLQPLVTQFRTAFGSEAQDTATRFREFGQHVGNTISEILPPMIRFVSSLADLLDGLSRVVGPMVNFARFVTDIATTLNPFATTPEPPPRPAAPSLDDLLDRERVTQEQFNANLARLNADTGASADGAARSATAAAAAANAAVTGHLGREGRGGGGGGGQSIVSHQNYRVEANAINLHFQITREEQARDIATQVRNVLPAALAEAIERSFVAGGF